MLNHLRESIPSRGDIKRVEIFFQLKPRRAHNRIKVEIAVAQRVTDSQDNRSKDQPSKSANLSLDNLKIGFTGVILLEDEHKSPDDHSKRDEKCNDVACSVGHVNNVNYKTSIFFR
jgi:hypothetical protein